MVWESDATLSTDSQETASNLITNIKAANQAPHPSATSLKMSLVKTLDASGIPRRLATR